MKIRFYKFSLGILIISLLFMGGCARKKTYIPKDITKKSTKPIVKKERTVDEEMKTAHKLINNYYVLNINKNKKSKTVDNSVDRKFVELKNKDSRFAMLVTVVPSNKTPIETLSNLLSNIGLLLEVKNSVQLVHNIPYTFKGSLYDYLVTLCNLNGIGFDYKTPGKVVLKAFETKTYDVSYINVIQKYNITMSSSTSGDSSTQATTSQNLELKTEMKDSDLWQQIQNDLSVIASNKGYFTINKALGTVTITDRIPFFEKYDNYFKKLKERLSKEVFLDVKVLEVTYDSNKEQGIDWNALALGKYNGNKLGIRTNFVSGSPDVFDTQPPGFSSLSLPVLTVSDADDVIKFIAGFVKGKGKLTVKSQPRQLVLNGQPAVIPVGQIIKYISNISSDSGSDSSLTGGDLSYSVETGTLQTGVVLQFLPKVTDDNNIVLNLGVTINRLDKMDEKSLNGIILQLPQTSVRAVSSTVKMKSGQTIVIGGILSDNTNEIENKVPLVGDIPILGNLFKYKKKEKTKTEMIVIITAHVVELT
ncbi:hypothetical protein DEFDS_P017 (plasmid) [Deferribacter desulfuricans SSM1]|uniref:Type II/III secretion system secretin-like domain-containing protein n=1 Tax=Deferribacter desulfuricans (strain DSM 14783 / JCM 11476 / NBRC 101012 / SSM1) TaxID=639282 RepID=D3PEK3_DEFDS|nr:type II and III secretion system protein [Deferribacter desulfuricans]BAI81645.1 hypothetical protein DEFDS_P017 [Deferribacter desulfuricans SSM1]